MSDDGARSQADIDAKMAGGSSAGDAGDPPASDSQAESSAGDTASGGIEDGLRRQADVDATPGKPPSASSPTDTPPPESGGGSSGAMSQTDIDAALAEAIAAQNAANDAVQPSPAPDAAPRSDAAAMGLPDFVTELASSTESAAAIDMLHDIDLTVTIELGRTHLHVSDVLRLGAGSVVELDKLAGDPVDVYVNERLVARGEVLVLNDTFCVRVNEIVMPPSRLVG